MIKRRERNTPGLTSLSLFIPVKMAPGDPCPLMLTPLCISPPPPWTGAGLGTCSKWIKHKQSVGLKLPRLGHKRTVASVLSSLSHSLAALLWRKQLPSLELLCGEEQMVRSWPLPPTANSREQAWSGPSLQPLLTFTQASSEATPRNWDRKCLLF